VPWLWDSQYQDLIDRLGRIESGVYLILRREGLHNVATQAALDRLAADVTANTDATASAAAALAGFVQTVAELTQKLQDAIAADDTAAVEAAANALEANNATLVSAIPHVSQAVVANTK
jgi:hypothetical protein